MTTKREGIIDLRNTPFQNAALAVNESRNRNALKRFGNWIVKPKTLLTAVLLGGSAVAFWTGAPLPLGASLLAGASLNAALEDEAL